MRDVGKSMVWKSKYSVEEAKATTARVMRAGKSRIAHQYSKDEYASWGFKED